MSRMEGGREGWRGEGEGEGEQGGRERRMEGRGREREREEVGGRVIISPGRPKSPAIK